MQQLLPIFMTASQQLCSARRRVSGAQGRNRTTDTRIFSPLLYQLSYLGIRLRADHVPAKACGVGFSAEAGRVIARVFTLSSAVLGRRKMGGHGRRIQAGLALARREGIGGPARLKGRGRGSETGSPAALFAGASALPAILGTSGFLLASGQHICARKPSVEVDILAALGAEWIGVARRRSSAFGAGAAWPERGHLFRLRSCHTSAPR